jgi:coenzyme F420-reducing hydrogenase delta subunit
MSNSQAAIAQSNDEQASVLKGERAKRLVVAFICENCARRGPAATPGFPPRPTTPDFGWLFPVSEVVIPCAGRLQPEHFLKAFEHGADAVAVICCEEGNCHHIEGSRRCQRRLDYVNRLITEAGLGGDRLMSFHLPGSAAEDMALQPGAPTLDDLAMNRKIAAVRDALAARLAKIPRSPLGKSDLTDESPYEVDSEDESDE